MYFCFIDYERAFVWITTNCEKFFKRWEYQTALETCMQVKKQQLEPYMEQQAGWKLGKEYDKAALSPCLFHAGLEEAQTGIKIFRRNISNLRYAVYTTLMAESEEEIKSLLKRVEEENEKAGLKFSIQKTIIMHLVPSFHGK